jgi:hypothetical protein
MKRSREIDKLFPALVTLQAELPLAERDRTNDFDHYSYATLASVVSAIKPLLEKNELAVIHTTTMTRDEQREIILETMLLHTSGQWIQSHLPIRAVPFPGQKDRTISPRNTGSALTYAKRYSTLGIIGMAPHPEEDDDGEEGSGIRKRKAAADAPGLEPERSRWTEVTGKASPGRGASRGAGVNPEPSQPSGVSRPAGASSQDSMTNEQRCNHFAEFLTFVFGGNEDAAFERAAECSSFVGDDGSTIRVRSWNGLATKPKWLHSTIRRYDETRGELPEYDKDWVPEAATDETEGPEGLPF